MSFSVPRINKIVVKAQVSIFYYHLMMIRETFCREIPSQEKTKNTKPVDISTPHATIKRQDIQNNVALALFFSKIENWTYTPLP